MSPLAANAADGANGEIRGYLWPGGNNIPNWEGTYRMPDGSEGWCASIWSPEPIYADSYADGGTLTLNNGAAIPEQRLRELAYIISTASDIVINNAGKTADNYAAAVSVIVHDWTNSDPSDYNMNWPLDAFDQGLDPAGTGQRPQEVRGVLNQLIADAQLYAGPWTIAYDTPPTGSLIGETIALGGTLLSAAGTPVPGKIVDLSATGGTLAQAESTTGPDGRFVATVTLDADSVTLGAGRFAPASTVTMRVPESWQGSVRPQNMVVIDNNRVDTSAVITAEPAPEPEIGTSATNQETGDKTLPYTGGTILDTVTYTGLTPGQEYTLTGELFDKATSDPTGILGEATFTPETADGTTAVTFTVPAGHAGKSLVVFEKLYNAEGTLVASHEDITSEEQTVTVNEEPTLHTSATNQETGDKTLPYTGGTILDTVTYTGLTPGQEYTLTGELFDKATSDPTGILGEATFTPETADGTTAVTFTVPAGHAGKSLVVFEKLYNAEGTLVASHEDITSEEQTVTVNEEPTLHTSATNQETGDKTLPYTGGTILDTVTYTGLTPGQEYTLTGELFDKATSDPTGILGEATFTPETADGTTAVTFTVPAGHAGKSLVVFEKLYNAEGTLVASHEDITSEEQTVTVDTEPPPPTKPPVEKPAKPVAPPQHPTHPGTPLAHTGGADATGAAIAALMLLLAGAGVAFAARRRERG